MYASDLTNRKRAQAVFSDISRQKKLVDSGVIMRVNYQKGGTDYAYMMELEQGCIKNTCKGDENLITKSGNGTTRMSIDGATYVDSSGNIDYGYIIPTQAGTTLISGSTMDDVYLRIPMGSMNFNFFGQQYNSSTPMYWSSNCAIMFQNPGKRVVSVQSNPYPAILLGNGDRRLDNLYVRDDSILEKFSILSLFVFYEEFSSNVSIPNTGQYQVRIIKQLTGEKRQWIEVRVAIAPASSGYIANQQTTDTNPLGGNSYADPTKLSPYNITNGSSYMNPCGTTFATVGPAAGTSFTFESDSSGSSWIFRNNTYVPV